MLCERSVGEFGDARRAMRGEWLMDRIVASGSLVARVVGEGRAGEIGLHRFLAAEQVTKEEIVKTLSQRTQGRCRGRRIVVAQDTTEINFAGRDAGRHGLGPGGDGSSAGFFIHAAVAVDVVDEAVVGLAEAKIWTRSGKVTRSRRERRFEDKESVRWLRTAEAASERLRESSQVIVVGDRESDIYPVFARRSAGCDLIVRVGQNRALSDGGRLFERAVEWTALGETTVRLTPRRAGETGRTARVEVRAGRVTLRRPSTASKTEAEQVELTLVEAREAAAPKGATALHWRLLATLPARTAQEAQEVLQLYRLRWRIEEVFRLLKNEGLRLPDVQMRDGTKLLKLAAMGLAAAVRILQLVDARDGGSRSALDVVDQEAIDAAAIVGPTLEGKTARQRNPHRLGSLAWLAWIAARLGGWNCYYKPPGPKTMCNGWNRLAAMLDAIRIHRQALHNA